MRIALAPKVGRERDANGPLAAVAAGLEQGDRVGPRRRVGLRRGPAATCGAQEDRGQRAAHAETIAQPAPPRSGEHRCQAVDPTHHLVCVRVRALSVAGQPARVCAPSDYVDTMTYDDRGRVTNDGMYAYVHGHGGSAKATWLGGAEPDSERVHPASFDAQGRLTRLGNRKFTYDAEGHLTRAKSGKHFESWAYTPDGTYAYTNNFPDSWEDCEADLIEVKRDKRGLNTVEVYDGCQIAATPATLTITRDAAGRPTKIDVDTHHDGTIEFTITADYSCHGG